MSVTTRANDLDYFEPHDPRLIHEALVISAIQRYELSSSSCFLYVAYMLQSHPAFGSTFLRKTIPFCTALCLVELRQHGLKISRLSPNCCCTTGMVLDHRRTWTRCRAHIIPVDLDHCGSSDFVREKLPWSIVRLRNSLSAALLTSLDAMNTNQAKVRINIAE